MLSRRCPTRSGNRLTERFNAERAARFLLLNSAGANTVKETEFQRELRKRADPMKIAIVHERLYVLGGAERVILALHQMFPEAPIYTSFVDHSKMSDAFKKMDIRTSYMQKLPEFLKKKSDKLLPLYMLAFQDFDLAEYDVVLSSSYVAAKSVLTPS